MAWASSKVKKYLAETCQLNGLHLREVQASYTSRQDSRTGAPGVRCQDVPVLDFMTRRWWQKTVKQAQEKRKKDQGTARERYIVDLAEKCATMSEEEQKNALPLRIPVKGGDLFVSANPKSSAAKGLQADLNAAANIGLRALIDPDWPGKWWYVPCDTKEFKPIADKVKGSHAVDLKKALQKHDDTQDNGDKTDSKKNTKKKGGKTKEIVNLWRNVSGKKLTDCLWMEYPAYGNCVEKRVVDILREEANILQSGGNING